ncbi:hypothetical protein TNCV_4521041 [Trichonephila clavipes]|nr:hypothetical protein TNCV_4521041 [Trichonephila clavipes]
MSFSLAKLVGSIIRQYSNISPPSQYGGCDHRFVTEWAETDDIDNLIEKVAGLAGQRNLGMDNDDVQEQLTSS